MLRTRSSMQSRSDSIGRAHSDGWGIACYENGSPHLERRALAAFEDLYFSSTAERVYAKTVVAHIRLATVGQPKIENCHPFQVGVWTFAHNGTITAIDTLRESLQQELRPPLRHELRGDTDSELFFLWMMSRLLDHNAVSLDGSSSAGCDARCHFGRRLGNRRSLPRSESCPARSFEHDLDEWKSDGRDAS